MKTMTPNSRRFGAVGFSILALLAAASTVHAQFEVVNRGMRGYSVGKVAQAWPASLKDGPPPDVVVLIVGTNDMINSEYLTPLDTFRDQYDSLVDELRRTSRHVVVGTLPPCVEEHLFRRHKRELYAGTSPNERIQQANAIIKEIASHKGIPVVNLDSIFSPGTWEEGNPKGLLLTSAASGRPDGVHPNEAGAEMIGRAVAERVKSLGVTGGTIMCLGDSITYGGGLRGAGTTEGETYPAVVLELLNGSASSDDAVCFDVKATEVRRPNVVFILADDQGWGDAGYNGHPYARTPNLDRLAADGTFITNFYVNGTVCSPSRAAFLTGMYPARLGFHHITSKPDVNKQRQVPDWLDPEVSTIADTFKKAGYATAHFGKWHLGKHAGAPAPPAYGFDESAVTSGSGERLRVGSGNEDPFLVTEATFDRAIDFISDHKGQPFYVNVWSPLPHAPLRPSPEQIQAFHDVKPDPASFGRWMRDYVNAARAPAGQLRTYLAAIAEVDRHVGRLREALRQLGLADDTIIVFSSDNGPEDYCIGNAANAGMGSPGPLRGRKRSLYEGGTRVPFVAVWPGRISAGRVDTETVMSGVDLTPTLAALAGIPCAAPGIDGEDLSAALRGGSSPRRRPLHWEWFFEVVGNAAFFAPPLAVRDGSWKFYCDYAGANTELYDVTKDPEELENVAAHHQDVVDRLRNSALTWVTTLPPAPLRDAVAKGADRMTLLDIREARPRKPE